MTAYPFGPANEDLDAQPARRIRLTHPREVSVERPEYLKADWYPLDVVTIIAGAGGVGKSSLVLADVAAATRGELDGDLHGPIRVAITASEDSKGMQKARLQAVDADEAHWAFLDVAELIGGEYAEGDPRLPGDLDEIEQVLDANGVKLWVIDPINKYMDGDPGKREDVRRVLDPLTALARKLHIAVVIVMHFVKGGGKAGDKIAGSAAFRDVARSVLLVAHDEQTGERVITVNKSNYSAAQDRSWSFTLDQTEIMGDDGKPIPLARARVTGESETSVEQIINRAPAGGEDEGEADAKNFLLDYLTHNGGEALAGEVIKAGAAAGFTMDELKKARYRTKNPTIATKKLGKGGWVWTIDGVASSEGANQGAEGPRPLRVAPLAPSSNQASSEASEGATFPEGASPKRVAPLAPSRPSQQRWTDPQWGDVVLVKGKAVIVDADRFSAWTRAGSPSIPIPEGIGA